jgi:L,D-peptidoglycan transpeptidase YkuD (ErfK/YbiS/YcfS/YnhG family)
VGVWKLGDVYYRPDRCSRPATGLPAKPSRATNAWCEDAADCRYNSLISMPAGKGNETFWREDCAYDVVIPTDHNTRPRVRGFGSAIFFHLARPGSEGTAGCIAVSARDMRKILARCGRNVVLVIWPPEGWPPPVFQK